MYKSVNVWNFHCECGETFTRNTIKKRGLNWVEILFLWSPWHHLVPYLRPQTLLSFEDILMHWKFCHFLQGHFCWCIQPTPQPLFMLKIWWLCSAKSELKIWGSIEATTWRCATIQQQTSSTPRPTTGCFWLNKDFLLSSEVPTDAFIGAKFTLCARRKLPLFGLKVQLTYVCAACGLFLIKADSLTLHSHVMLWGGFTNMFLGYILKIKGVIWLKDMFIYH